jgi:hypothetical protein
MFTQLCKFGILISIIPLVGCAGSGSSSPASGPEFTSSSYKEEKQLDPKDGNRYAVGCKKPGDGEHQGGGTDYKLDERLKTGMRFYESVSSIDESETKRKATYSSEVISKSSQEAQIRHQLISKDLVTLQSLKNNAVSTCNPAGEPLCRTKGFFHYEIDHEVNGHTEKCRILSEGKNALSQGKFTFADGSTTVSAFKESWTTKGIIECSGQDVEPGVSIAERVVSNDVPGLPFASCGGVKVYEKSYLKGDSGKIYWTKFSEVLSYK